MNYTKISRFIDKCLKLLENPPRKEQEHEVFLFQEKGMTIFLKLYAAQTDIRFRKFLHWELYAPDYGYRATYCENCTPEDPCVWHEVGNVIPLNAELIRNAKRANSPEIGLSVTVPEPIYPKAKRQFHSHAEFRGAIENIYPAFSEQTGWTFPKLPRGLEWQNTDTNYPRIVGYSINADTLFYREFHCARSVFSLFTDLRERMPPFGHKREPLIRKLMLLIAQFKAIEELQKRERELRLERMKRRALNKERAELARKFNASHSK